ncbi:MAG: L,D-transpeptidase family protein [Gammaproteobacteria bacterium]|nr:L,D-transpeptidase family protein [Gammaproteobacteria bacterium]
MKLASIIFTTFYSAAITLVGAAVCSSVWAVEQSLDNSHPEVRLLDAVQDIQASDLNSAESKLKTLVSEMPDFKLAQLVYADVLMSKVKGIHNPGPDLNNSLEKSLLLTEIKNRYQAVNDDLVKTNFPKVLAKLDAFYRNVIVVDLSKSRLYLFDNTQPLPVLIDDYYISMGRSGAGKISEGDLKTPLGVYFIQSYIAPDQLADKYGAGAYPINYPNAWDRLNGKTGHGIWLHGTRSGTYNRPPLASEGCVVLPNEDLLNIGSHIDLKSTPVLIGDNITWLAEKQWLLHKDDISQLHEQWKNDWESMDVESYLQHYSDRFTSGKKDIYNWSDHKRRIAKHKTFVKVNLSNVSLLQHPNEDVMVATYLQTYASDNFSSQSWKRQYWNKENDGKWRIVFEGEISMPLNSQLAQNRKNE